MISYAFFFLWSIYSFFTICWHLSINKTQAVVYLSTAHKKTRQKEGTSNTHGRSSVLGVLPYVFSFLRAVLRCTVRNEAPIYSLVKLVQLQFKAERTFSEPNKHAVPSAGHYVANI